MKRGESPEVDPSWPESHISVNRFIFTGSILVLESAVTIPSIPEAID
jgi:hypothetical protein